jgi:hypothetical protein
MNVQMCNEQMKYNQKTVDSQPASAKKKYARS